MTPSRLLHLARLKAFRYDVDDVAHFVHQEVAHCLLVAGVVATDGVSPQKKVAESEKERGRRHRHKLKGEKGR